MSRTFVQYYRPDRIPESVDVIVVGSGMAGLSAASCLAQRGARVLVLERHETPGGMTHDFQRNGYSWDVGLHYVGRVNESSHAVARAMRHVTGDRLRWQPLADPYDSIEFPNGRFGLPPGRRRLEAALVDRFPQEAAGIRDYLKLLPQVARAMQYKFLGEALARWLGPWVAEWSSHRLNRFGVQTTAQALDRLTQNRELRAILCGQWGNYGLPPGESSFAAHAIIAEHYMLGGAYPVGGSNQIARSVVPIVESAGGAVLARADVERILVQHQGQQHRAVGVAMQDGHIIHADKVISAAGAHATRTRLLAELGEAAPYSSFARLRPATGHFALFLGARGTPEELGVPATNLWIYPSHDHDANVARFRSNPNAALPLVYISAVAAKDPDYQKRHPGRTALEAIVPSEIGRIANGGEPGWQLSDGEYERLKQQMHRRILDTVLARLPKLAPALEWSELATPQTTNHLCATANGEMYGVGAQPQRFQAIHTARSAIKGLELAGQDSLLFGIGGAVLSGVLAAQRLEGMAVLRDVFGPQQSRPAPELATANFNYL